MTGGNSDAAPASVAGISLEGSRFFIARRLPGGDLGGKWEFPGGKVESGESDEAALIREFREEFDVCAAPGAFLGNVFFEHRGVKRELRAYLISIEGVPVLREHGEWKRAALDEIEALDFADSDRRLFPALKRFLNSNGLAE